MSVYQSNQRTRPKTHNYPVFFLMMSLHITFPNFQLMVSRSEINFQETGGTIKLIKRSYILGKGYLFLMVTLFNWRQSIHILRELSFFLANKTGAPQGEKLGQMKPLSNSSLNCSFNSNNSSCAILYDGIEIGRVFGMISMPKYISLSGGTPGRSSRKTFGNSFTKESD